MTDRTPAAQTSEPQTEAGRDYWFAQGTLIHAPDRGGTDVGALIGEAKTDASARSLVEQHNALVREAEAQRFTVEQYGLCPTAIRPGYDRPSDWPWRYSHAASIEGAHWNIYTALGDINRDYFIGMVGYEADAKAIVEQHNAALAREETGE
jgi:hypothetical protein